MGLFDLSGEQEKTPGSIPVPQLAELSEQDRMSMEKDVTGLYLSGHPMDAYRSMLQNANVAPIGAIMECFETGGTEFADEQIVSVAGMVQQMKMKTTRNNSLMAYLTLEDNSGSMELLMFSGTIDRFGGFITENAAVVFSGRISVRDEKAPQMIVNHAWPLETYARLKAEEPRPAPAPNGKLYLQIPSENSREDRRVRPVLQMFPGKVPVILYYADTKIRRQSWCQPGEELLQELRTILGEKNVVLK